MKQKLLGFIVLSVIALLSFSTTASALIPATSFSHNNDYSILQEGRTVKTMQTEYRDIETHGTEYRSVGEALMCKKKKVCFFDYANNEYTMIFDGKRVRLDRTIDLGGYDVKESVLFMPQGVYQFTSKSSQGTFAAYADYADEQRRYKDFDVNQGIPSIAKIAQRAQNVHCTTELGFDREYLILPNGYNWRNIGAIEATIDGATDAFVRSQLRVI